MLTKPQLVDVLKANYADSRMYGASLFIQELLQRKTHGYGIPQYRMTNKNTSVVITSQADYENALDPAKLLAEFPFFSEKLTSDRTASFLLTPTNIEVSFHENSKSDIPFSKFLDFGNNPDARYNVQYMIGYMNDADAALPLKIIWQRLVRVQST